MSQTGVLEGLTAVAGLGRPDHQVAVEERCREEPHLEAPNLEAPLAELLDVARPEELIPEELIPEGLGPAGSVVVSMTTVPH